MVENIPPYRAFGDLLARLRVAAGFVTQQDLATALDVRQQTVSRWEKGLARPRAKEIAALERAVKAKDGELLSAAGHNLPPAPQEMELATTIERPLPLTALTPETFESFSAALLHEIYRPLGGVVRRYGGNGHMQDGIDILVTGGFGTHTFQCKRVSEFGAQKVHTAVATQTFAAEVKVLLLATVASPGARDAMAKHAGWELWDREDISRNFHTLARTVRLDLVDRFFNGRRRDLLGETDPGPIQTPSDFFKPFEVEERYFNHGWELVGRADSLKSVVDSVCNEAVTVTGIVGAPGSGKSRLLKAVIEELGANAPFHIRFLSPTEEAKAHHLDQLRDSRRMPTLLVVDDAHDRDDIETLLRFAANPSNKARLLLSLRPYGKEPIRLKAAGVSLSGNLVNFVELKTQTHAEARALAEAVLKKCGGPLSSAAGIAAATHSTPLATVLAAQLVAKDKVSLALVSNEQEFRTHVLRSLQDVIAVKLVSGQDAEKLRAVLRVVALFQPVILDDPALLSVLEKAEGVGDADAARLLRLLEEAGVLFKRGLRSRLAPDLLADEVIQSAYLTSTGSANDAVSKVFELATTEQLKHLFSNLGRLDWRLRDGNTDESPLLNSLAPKLRWLGKYENSHVEAVEAIAYYHPRFALNFAASLIRDDHGDNESVCNIVRNAAYTYNHLEEACSLLWKAGRQDKRELHQHSNHGIRILKSLAEFEPNKPVEYIKTVVRFALELLERPASLKGAHTPFSVLEGALNSEMESSTFSGRTLTISHYRLPFDFAKDVRNEVTDALLRYMREAPLRRAYLAAQLMANALHGPRHGDPGGLWKQSHVRLLKKLRTLCNLVTLPPVVLVRLVKSSRWHADYGWEETAVEAQAITTQLDRDLRTRLVRVLMDGWGTETWNFSKAEGREEHRRSKEHLTVDLMEKFPAASQLFDELNSCLKDIEQASGGAPSAAHLFINPLLVASPGLSKEVLLRHESGKAGNLTSYVGASLSALVQAQDSALVEEYIAQSEGSLDALKHVAEAYARFEPTRGYTATEIALLRRIFATEDPEVLWMASTIARQVARRDAALALELICLSDLSINIRATRDMFMLLAGDTQIPAAVIDTRRAELLLKLKPLKKLDDYWLQAFLATSMRRDPEAVMSLVIDRVKAAAKTKDWSFVPLQKEFHGEGLKLMEVHSSRRLLVELLEVGLEVGKKSLSTSRLGEVVMALCGSLTADALETLLEWMEDGASKKVAVVTTVLREAQSTLIYEHPKFVRDVLNLAELLGDQAVEEIRSALFISVLAGIRTGSLGKPFDEDVRLLEHCTAVLATLSRAEPAFELYDALLKDAKHSISRKSISDSLLEADEQ